MKAEIVDGMARALWLTSYADYADENPDNDDISRAGGGEDWDDVAPETPEAAEKAARELATLFVQSNGGHSMDDLFDRARAAIGKAKQSPDLAHDFGFSMAMQALGHGVSWFDDHPKFQVTFPMFECHYDGDELTWSGRPRTQEWGGAKGRNPDAFDVPGVTNPAFRVGDRARLNPIGGVTIGDFYRTGVQDCQNVMDSSDFYEEYRRGQTDAKKIVRSVWAEWESDPDFEKQWHSQSDEMCEGLDPAACYLAWRDGWMACATDKVSGLIRDQWKDYERNPDKFGVTNPFIGWNAQGKALYGPDVRVQPSEAAHLEPMRGYGSILAAFDSEGRVIGWVVIEDTGYKTAKEWAKATGWKETNPGKPNPAGIFTEKGERMYEDIKAGYGSDPRAAEIAARTVYARAHEGVPGLIRTGRGRPPGVPNCGK